MTYQDKLKDPRWQKKRLEIFQRDKFKCRMCNNADRTLNVHHCEYGRNPWDVPDSSLVTLCDSCHDDVENVVKSVRKLAASSIMQLGALQNLIAMLESPAVFDADSVLRAMRCPKLCTALGDLCGEIEAHFQKGIELGSDPKNTKL